VTLDGTDGSIVKADPVGKRTNLTQEDKIINIAIFEENVDAAATDLDGNPKYFSTDALDSRLRLEDG